MTEEIASRSKMARLFVALWPPDATREALVACRDQTVDPRAAPVADARLHLTLHFLGPVARQREPLLRTSLAVGVEPFELVLSRVERWPHGLVVLAGDDVPAAMARLHAELAGRLRDLDIPVESRPLRPHVTLARHAPPGRIDGPSRSVVWPVSSYALVESTFGRGAAYHTIALYR